MDKNPQNVVLGKVQPCYRSGIISPKEALEFFFFLRITENKTNVLMIGLGGKN